MTICPLAALALLHASVTQSQFIPLSTRNVSGLNHFGGAALLQLHSSHIFLQFYARFDTDAHKQSVDNLKDTLSTSDPDDTYIHTVDVAKTFKSLNCNKACGPDAITPRILKTFADQLAPVHTKLFNQSHIPYIFHRYGRPRKLSRFPKSRIQVNLMITGP